MKAEELQLERRRIGTWGVLNPMRVKAVLAHAGKKVLDAGCANGEYVFLLLEKGYDAYGLDLLPSDAWAGPQQERFSVGDVRRLPYGDGEFDTVLLLEVLEHVADVDEALQEVRRVCRGNLVLSVPDARLDPLFAEAGLAFYHWVDRSHVQFFTADGLRAALERNGFVLRQLTGINPVSPELLFFFGLRLPLRLARLLARACRRLTWRRPRFMTLLAIADRNER